MAKTIEWQRPDPGPRADRAPTRLQLKRSPGPTARRPGFELPVELLVLQRMKLIPAHARLTEISRSAAFIASTFQPEEGQQIVMRVAHGGGSGTAVGQVQTTLEGKGFTVRVFASTEVFRTYADSVRLFLGGAVADVPSLDEPFSIQVL